MATVDTFTSQPLAYAKGVERASRVLFKASTKMAAALTPMDFGYVLTDFEHICNGFADLAEQHRRALQRTIGNDPGFLDLLAVNLEDLYIILRGVNVHTQVAAKALPPIRKAWIGQVNSSRELQRDGQFPGSPVRVAARKLHDIVDGAVKDMGGTSKMTRHEHKGYLEATGGALRVFGSQIPALRKPMYGIAKQHRDGRLKRVVRQAADEFGTADQRLRRAGTAYRTASHSIWSFI